jgi:hypothetical protein
VGCAGQQSPLRDDRLSKLDAPAEWLYDHMYCQRGEAENRIMEAQIGLFATRTSCHHFARVLLAALAYIEVNKVGLIHWPIVINERSEMVKCSAARICTESAFFCEATSLIDCGQFRSRQAVPR